MTRKRLAAAIIIAGLFMIAIAGGVKWSSSDADSVGVSLPAPVQGVIDLQALAADAEGETIPLHGE